MNVVDARGPRQEAALTAARDAVDRGHVLVMPTDTVYGIAARPDRPGATDRIFAAKRRPRDLTLPVLVQDRQAAELVAVFDDRARLLADRFWPGGLTIVLPRGPHALTWDLGESAGTVGVRVPAHDVALRLLDQTGPLAVTSANVSGEPTPPDCEGVRAALGEAVAIYLCAGPCDGRPSTLVDLTGPNAEILRQGVIPAADVLAALPG